MKRFGIAVLLAALAVITSVLLYRNYIRHRAPETHDNIFAIGMDSWTYDPGSYSICLGTGACKDKKGECVLDTRPPDEDLAAWMLDNKTPEQRDDLYNLLTNHYVPMDDAHCHDGLWREIESRLWMSELSFVELHVQNKRLIKAMADRQAKGGEPATAGTAAGSHATKALSTGPADVGVGRKAFPSREHPAVRPYRSPKIYGYFATSPLNGTTSHDLQFGRDAKHNDVAVPNDAGAAYCEEFGSRNGLVCIGRTAPPVPATPFSGFGVVTKEPLVAADGRGPLGSSAAGWNIANGDQAGASIIDGEYDLCLGEGTCKRVVHRSCVVDIGPPSHAAAQHMLPVDLKYLSFMLSILQTQDEFCNDGKDRVNLYLDWLIASSKLEPSLPLTTGIGNPVVGDAAGQLTTGTDGWHPVPAPVKGKP